MKPRVKTELTSKTDSPEEFSRSESLEYLELLHDRFKNLNDLRTMTARHHITILGGVLAFLAFTGGRSEGYVRTFLPHIVLATSVFLAILGYCVMAYDWRIRQRTFFVAREIEDIVVSLGRVPRGSRNDTKVMDEDYWFFSQMIAANALTLVVLVNALGAIAFRSMLEFRATLAGLLVFVIDVILFAFFWMVLTRLWLRGGDRYRRQIANWTPS